MKRLHNFKVVIFLTLGMWASRHCEARSNPNAKERPTHSSKIASCLAMTTNRDKTAPEPRIRTSFNKDWKFFLGDKPNAKSL